MHQGSMQHTRPGGKVLSSISIIWLLASAVTLFTLENIWVDPWLRNKSRHIPSIVPEPLSALWFLALLIVCLVCVFLIVAQVLVAKDRGIPLRKRVGTGLAAFFALVLGVLWVCVTSGMTSGTTFGQETKRHSVTLMWKASTSPVKGYNVYRGTKPGGPYVRINSEFVREPTYKDEDVRSGTTYYYVTRAVDANGRESSNSNETTAAVP